MRGRRGEVAGTAASGVKDFAEWTIRAMSPSNCEAGQVAKQRPWDRHEGLSGGSDFSADGVPERACHFLLLAGGDAVEEGEGERAEGDGLGEG